MSFPSVSTRTWAFDILEQRSIDRVYEYHHPMTLYPGLLIPSDYWGKLQVLDPASYSGKKVCLESLDQALNEEFARGIPKKLVLALKPEGKNYLAGYYLSSGFLDLYNGVFDSNIVDNLKSLEYDSKILPYSCYCLLLAGEGTGILEFNFDSVADLAVQLTKMDDVFDTITQDDLKGIQWFVNHALEGDVAKVSIENRWNGYVIRR